MLKIKDLHVSYGGIKALRGVDLEVPDGKIVTLIGANGAGRSCWGCPSTRYWSRASPSPRRGGGCSPI